ISKRDWSSDVCSSDLYPEARYAGIRYEGGRQPPSYVRIFIVFVNTKTLGVLLALPGLYNQEYRLHHTNCQLKIRRASCSPFFPLSDDSLLCDRPYIVALLFPTV